MHCIMYTITLRNKSMSKSMSMSMSCGLLPVGFLYINTLKLDISYNYKTLRKTFLRR